MYVLVICVSLSVVPVDKHCKNACNLTVMTMVCLIIVSSGSGTMPSFNLTIEPFLRDLFLLCTLHYCVLCISFNNLVCLTLVVSLYQYAC